MKKSLSRKPIALILTVVMIASLAFSTPVFATMSGASGGISYTGTVADVVGDGTAESPYEIGTPDQLKEIPTLGLSAHYRLTSDIVINGGTNVWVPIGIDTATVFSGSFDGDGHTITMGTAAEPVVFTTARYAGLFGVIRGDGTTVNVKDLTVAGAIVSAYAAGNQGATGAVAAHILGSGIIENCAVSANVTAHRDAPSGGVGGIVGKADTQNNTSKLLISGCSMTGDVMADGRNSTLGGIVGSDTFSGGTILVVNCFTTGNVTAEGRGVHAGGVVGQHYNFGTGNGSVLVSQCYSTGTVSVNSKSDVAGGAGDIIVGGVVGWNYSGMGGLVTLSECYATGDVALIDLEGGTRNYVGGITGENYGDFFATATVTQCYATGLVTLDGSGFVGGIAGRNAGGSNGVAVVEKSVALNKGVISGSTTIGRIVGSTGNKTLTDNLGLAAMNDGLFTSETANGINGADLSEGNAQLQSTYEALAWKFPDVWMMKGFGGVQRPVFVQLAEASPAPALALSLDKVRLNKGEYFNVKTASTETIESNTVALDFCFDSEQIAYAGYTLPVGVEFVSREISESGLRLILMVQDYSMKDLVTVMFEAKETVLDSAELFKVVGRFVVRAEAGKEILTLCNILDYYQPDDPELIDLIYLSNVIDAFGKSKNDTDWPEYRRYDFDGNGKIDILDITYAASYVKI